MLNLITDAWLPVMRASGATDVVRPSDLTDGIDHDPITALAFPRPDWNAAVLEFLIGLHAVAAPLSDAAAVVAQWRDPPKPDDLAASMAPLASAFEMTGDGPCAFQDFDPLADAELKPVQQILIDAPGANTAKLNQDLFIRRRGADHMLNWPYAAAALITLQLYAPSGGAGHRTSMRGGGPLTTLVRPHRPNSETRLFDIVLVNQPRGHSAPPLDARLFPWLGETRTSENKSGCVTMPDDAHPLQAFFATPRRIRLEGDAAGVTAFRTLAYGVNYEGWIHPLSPYYLNKADLLPLHPREGQPTYRDWPGLWGASEDKRAAACVSAFNDILEQEWIDADLLAFGYDMDNAKARAWMETRAPAPLDEETRARADQMVRAGGEAAGALRFALKRALYGSLRERDGKTEIYLPDTTPMRACAEYATELELATEYLLRCLIGFLHDKSEADAERAFLSWHTELRGTSLRLFDRTVGLSALSPDDVFRIVRARSALAAAFSYKGKVTKELEIAERLKAERVANTQKELAE